jgi:pilus assembly protein Flp/PilA
LLTLSKFVTRWLKLDDEQGVTAIEYGLIAALIALAIITGITLLGTNLGALFNNIAGQLPAAGG